MKLISPRAFDPASGCRGIEYVDKAGPVGFEHIETAPRDGTWLRLRFRRREGEEIGQWRNCSEMKTGGSWFDKQGFYITPGPLFWAPHSPTAGQPPP